MKTILKLATAMAAAALFAAETETEPSAETESDEWNLAGLFDDVDTLGMEHAGYCLSYTENNSERQIYLTDVFPFDLGGWRNVSEDRPSTMEEVSLRFESDYTDWLQPRYQGVFRHRTHCWLFGTGTNVAKRREKEIEDFRELGHRVVETDWMPTF